MRHPTILALALVASATVGGCGGTMNRGLESVHQPVVSRTDYVFDVAAPGMQFGGTDAQRLGDWFDSLQLRYGDRVSVDAQGYGTAPREAVAQVAARYGLLVDETAPVTAGPIAPGAVRVVVSRMAATVPGCPDWSRPSNANFTGDSMSNYGCAINSNIAAMVADPRDLLAGRGSRVGDDAEVASKAIRTYRAKVPTGAGEVKTETTGGKN